MENAKSIGIAGWLTIIFVIAKITGIIAWSWWWVFSPLWITVGVCLILLIIVVIIALISTIIE